MPNVIIFGGTGWVGHHITDHFSKANYDVTVATRGQKKTFVDCQPHDCHQITGDKSNPADMQRILETRYDVVIDTVPTEESIDHIVKFSHGLKHYLHCSSTGGYAPLKAVPGDETFAYSDYRGGWKNKGIVDAKVMNLFFRSGFPATVLRPSYITGPGMVPLDNFGGRRADFILDLLKEKTLELPNDGMALLHPVHVDDLARSFLLAARQPQSIGQIYNICLDKAVTLTRYLQINAAALGKKASIKLMPIEAILKKYDRQLHELGLHFLAEHMCYDITKAKKQLGYAPGMTTAQAIEQTARWAQENTQR